MTADPKGSHALQAALDASEARFRSLVESAPDGIVISRAARVLYANPAAARMLGYADPSELVDLHMSAFLDATQMRAMAARLEAPREGGRALAPFAYRATRKDGGSLTVEITSLPIDFGGGPAVVAIARDVTDRVRMQAQLAHADRLAAIGTMAAGVAHEINNPLSYVGLGLQALKKHVTGAMPEGAEKKRALELVTEVLGGADRVAAIVRDLRAFARRDDEGEGPVDLHEVLAAAARMTSRAVGERASLSMETAGAHTVVGTAARLEQVFVNLLLNAAQAMRGDELGHIDVTTRGCAERVTVEVRDNGRGIAPEHLPRIFDPFFTTKPTGMGTGLGLSVCLGIVRAFGGDIEVETKPGADATTRSTTFRVLLRAADVKAARRSSTGRDPRLARSRILVVDDEPLIGRMIGSLLAPSHEVTVATSGEDALLAIRNGAFDAVLCDLLMPGMTGMELYDRVVAEHPSVAPTVVLMTGGAFTPGAQRFLARVKNRCLDKPFTLTQLEGALSEVQSGVQRRPDADADR